MKPDNGEQRQGRLDSRWQRLRSRLFYLAFLIVRPVTLGVRTLVLDREAGRVLLVRHTYVAGWHLPGGGVDPGESAAQAAVRELAEEANIETTARPVLISHHLNRRAGRRSHVALYLVESFRQTAPHLPTREIAEARFFALDQLPDNISPATARRISEVVDGEPPSDYW